MKHRAALVREADDIAPTSRPTRPRNSDAQHPSPTAHGSEVRSDPISRISRPSRSPAVTLAASSSHVHPPLGAKPTTSHESRAHAAAPATTRLPRPPFIRPCARNRRHLTNPAPMPPHPQRRGILAHRSSALGRETDDISRISRPSGVTTVRRGCRAQGVSRETRAPIPGARPATSHQARGQLRPRPRYDAGAAPKAFHVKHAHPPQAPNQRHPHESHSQARPRPRCDAAAAPKVFHVKHRAIYGR